MFLILLLSAATTFEDQQLHYRETLLIVGNQYGVYGGMVGHVSQGKYDRKLEWPEFYDVVKRDDLKQEYEARRALKIGLIVGGSVAFAGGLALGTVGMVGAMRNSVCLFRVCEPTEGYVAMGVIGGLIGVAGMGVLFGGLFYRVLKQQPHEIRALIDEHNDKLSKGELTFSPWFDARGGGGSFALTF